MTRGRSAFFKKGRIKCPVEAEVVGAKVVGAEVSKTLYMRIEHDYILSLVILYSGFVELKLSCLYYKTYIRNKVWMKKNAPTL